MWGVGCRARARAGIRVRAGAPQLPRIKVLHEQLGERATDLQPRGAEGAHLPVGHGGGDLAVNVLPVDHLVRVGGGGSGWGWRWG